MTNINTSQGYIEDAKIIWKEAQHSLTEGHYHRVVRKCQECVELSLKGIMRLMSIEYPKSHKIGKVIRKTFIELNIDPEITERIADIADKLTLDRELSFYGSEANAARDVFDEDDARQAIENARFIIDFIDDTWKRFTQTF
ncbi:MAG: HEPN domain-containing protein [Candidatus Schekmanbacteria bacterium]|nr:HEPN domain-containing protein [Candidatus Schekmanbacteria bacterium]